MPNSEADRLPSLELVLKFGRIQCTSANPPERQRVPKAHQAAAALIRGHITLPMQELLTDPDSGPLLASNFPISAELLKLHYMKDS
jgi:hypothetical protein